MQTHLSIPRTLLNTDSLVGKSESQGDLLEKEPLNEEAPKPAAADKSATNSEEATTANSEGTPAAKSGVAADLGVISAAKSTVSADSSEVLAAKLKPPDSKALSKEGTPAESNAVSAVDPVAPMESMPALSLGTAEETSTTVSDERTLSNAKTAELGTVPEGLASPLSGGVAGHVAAPSSAAVSYDGNGLGSASTTAGSKKEDILSAATSLASPHSSGSNGEIIPAVASAKSPTSAVTSSVSSNSVSAASSLNSSLSVISPKFDISASDSPERKVASSVSSLHRFLERSEREFSSFLRELMGAIKLEKFNSLAGRLQAAEAELVSTLQSHRKQSTAKADQTRSFFQSSSQQHQQQTKTSRKSSSTSDRRRAGRAIKINALKETIKVFELLYFC
eukprot:GHVT01068291.1.p1 GENE.GHVT01068291.1~~GHVT01068291.1.p1  ORF type:complete len:393 (+),score=61.36 GHVT01068291.1:1335-2513(+)